jgi:hypothetical protein
MRGRIPNKTEPGRQSIPEVLRESPFLKISFEASSQILICEWAELQTLESIKSEGAMILQALLEQKATAVLNDNFKVQRQWEDAVDWTTNEWFPAMIEAGLRHFAWVLSKDIFARISAKRAGQPHEVVRFFRSYHEAYHWLYLTR